MAGVDAPFIADRPKPAKAGIERVVSLSERCGIKPGMRHFGIERSDIPHMASAAITVTRLLERNLRVVTEADAVGIYEAAW